MGTRGGDGVAGWGQMDKQGGRTDQVGKEVGGCAACEVWRYDWAGCMHEHEQWVGLGGT